MQLKTTLASAGGQYTRLLILHNRYAWVLEQHVYDERGQLHSYVTGILSNLKSPLIEINSVRDHVHILFAQSKNCSGKERPCAGKMTGFVTS